MNAPTPPSALTPAVAEAVVGHNNPPAFDQAVLDEFKVRADEFLAVTKEWIDLPEIANEEQAGLCADQVTGLRSLWKEVDEARKAAKKPHDDAGKVVQAAFKPTLTKIETATDKLKPKIEKYATKRAEIEAAEKARAEAEAAEQAKAAAAKAAEAEASGDIGAQVEAEEERKAAEKQQKAAAKGPSTKVKSTTGSGRTMSLRTVKEVEITNINVLFMEFKNDARVHDLLKSLATERVRAKGYDAEADPIAGIKIVERKAMA